MKPTPLRPALLILATLCYACPTPKAGDDRLPLDAGSTADSGAGDVGPKDTGAADTGTADSGTADSGTGDADGGTQDTGPPMPDGGPPDDGGEPGCVPTGPEDCANGVDDDCQNGIDCMDPVCGTCVAVPGGFNGGIMVDANASCPAGFTETRIYSGLDPGSGCQGNCLCQPNPTRCLGELYIYNTTQECNNDANLIGGQLYAGLIDESCTPMPVAQGNPGGYRLGNWTVQQSCSATGVASPSPYSWSAEMKFCTATPGLQGCDQSSVCVPAPPQAGACLITGGGAACPDPFSNRMVQWFTGVSDTRSCGPCTCGASGGSCQFASISIGSDWLCTDSAEINQSSPRSCGSTYSPPARVTGFPQEPACTAASQQSGTVEGTGQQTICCAP
jgi:hypothetical protein